MKELCVHSISMCIYMTCAQCFDSDAMTVQVTAVAHFFRNSHQQIVAVVDAAPKTAQPIREGSVGKLCRARASILENVIAFLSDGGPPSTDPHLPGLFEVSR